MKFSKRFVNFFKRSDAHGFTQNSPFSASGGRKRCQ